MRAVRIDRPTLGSEVRLEEVPLPVVKPGWVLVRVMSFGLNDSERQLRNNEITQDWIPKPIVPGVECAGIVEDASDTDLLKGQRVLACMGGMGCAFDGSYAEYVLVPRDNVFLIPDYIRWSWVEFGAFPETYLTAWGSLFDCLQLQPADLLLVRGATCSLGFAAIQIARALGARVIATTHRESKLKLLDSLGVDESVVDDGNLKYKGIVADKILDLVGPLHLRDSLQCTDESAIVCSTGFLGGVISLDDFDPINDIPNGVHLTGYSSNYPNQYLYDDLFQFMSSFNLRPLVAQAFSFDAIESALASQDEGAAGKLVVVV